MTHKQLREEILKCLITKDFSKLLNFPLKKIANHVIYFLFSLDKDLKANAIEAIGIIVFEITKFDIEFARNIMRRLMWSLNEESGSIGWGAGEAMGEIMSKSEILAKEYRHILLSYVEKEKKYNYIENDYLRKEVLLGIEKLYLSDFCKKI